MASPKFQKGQVVEFIGGVGSVVNYRHSSGNWSYFVKMEMGLEPEFGRIGAETTVLLFETDIKLE
ncbi:MAG: hypothetical protein KME64_05680 [Scytonematopsis contorta HA4267-MV1]|jgi:hypothetical protein|nr:hypothetical protein [Scytonematopsis contorta HA4267-MV1]